MTDDKHEHDPDEADEEPGDEPDTNDQEAEETHTSRRRHRLRVSAIEFCSSSC